MEALWTEGFTFRRCAGYGVWPGLEPAALAIPMAAVPLTNYPHPRYIHEGQHDHECQQATTDHPVPCVLSDWTA
jgi:hypothetical protein